MTDNTRETLERLTSEVTHLKDHVSVTMEHNLILNLKVDRIKKDLEILTGLLTEKTVN